MQVRNSNGDTVADSTLFTIAVEGHGVFQLVEGKEGLMISLDGVYSRRVQSMTIEPSAVNSFVLSSRLVISPDLVQS